MAARFDFVYFDLDDTILDHRSAERHALVDLHKEIFNGLRTAAVPSVATLQAEYHETNVELWRRYSLAEITADQLRHDRFAGMSSRYELEIDPWTLSTRYMELYARHWSPIKGALEAFDTIAESIRVGIITNGFAATQHKKLDAFPALRKLSETIVISEEFGHMKPSRKLFDHASKLANAAGHRILYVGDSWHSDVKGGLGAGWNVAWLTTNAQAANATELDGADRLLCFSEWSDLIRYCSVDAGDPA